MSSQRAIEDVYWRQNGDSDSNCNPYFYGDAHSVTNAEAYTDTATASYSAAPPMTAGYMVP